MLNKKITFAVMFGNRGFFPSELQSAARLEISARLESLGYETLMMDAAETNHGAVETVEEGRKFARFLHEHKGEYQGIILSLPNFGDELGAAEALRGVDVPIFVQAYPDEMDKMSPALRRDSFCGKFALCDVLGQYGIKYTTLQPHVVAPGSDEFAANMDHFAKICRVHDGINGMRLLCAGARTTPFKSVRTDELALQTHGVSVETCDMADIISRVINCNSSATDDKAAQFKAVMDFTAMPADNFNNLVKLGVVMDEMVAEFDVDAIAIRCWIELQKQLGISPCLLNGLLCEKGIPVGCEVDVSNAVMMYALQCAAGGPATILDWNNNYGDDPNKCIVFHCGNVPTSMLTEKGPVIEHAILKETAGPDCSWGCSCSRLRPMEVTYGSLLTRDGKICAYGGVAKITDDEIPADFFGMAGVFETPNLQNALKYICNNGHRHHVSLAEGNVIMPLAEAFEKYLGFEIDLL